MSFERTVPSRKSRRSSNKGQNFQKFRRAQTPLARALRSGNLQRRESAAELLCASRVDISRTPSRLKVRSDDLVTTPDAVPHIRAADGPSSHHPPLQPRPGRYMRTQPPSTDTTSGVAHSPG